jgi:hypothetical protein
MGWTLFYLKRGTLIAFLLVQVMILAALIALGEIDQRNNGFTTTGVTKNYFWTYGPTVGKSDNAFIDHLGTVRVLRSTHLP